MKTEQRIKQKLVLGGLVAILVISSFMYLPAVADSGENDDNADDKDDDGIDDSYEEENKREVEIEYSSNEAKIQSSMESGEGVENQFVVVMKTGSDGLELELQFEEEVADNETGIEFKTIISEIVEFRDTVADGIYQSSEDETVQIYELNSFKPIDYSVQTINNDTVHVFFVETVDEVFSVTLYVTGEFANINDVIVAPTQVKVDVGIFNFNYTEDDSMLALKVKLESEIEVHYEENDVTDDEEAGHAHNEAGIDVNVGDYAAFFTWIETAMIDGVEQEIKATPLVTYEDESIMYLNYPRGTEIIHDPKVGLADLLPSTAGIDNMIFIAALALLAIPGLILIFRKKNRR